MPGLTSTTCQPKATSEPAHHGRGEEKRRRRRGLLRSTRHGKRVRAAVFVPVPTARRDNFTRGSYCYRSTVCQQAWSHRTRAGNGGGRARRNQPQICSTEFHVNHLENEVDGGGAPSGNKALLTVAAVLLALPIVALLLVGTYAREEPTLAGFPFFIWYQFLWVFLCAACTFSAYRLVLVARPRRPFSSGGAKGSGTGR
ncbi:MAG: DUF3311 domain-containing protein [Vicinamibacterales bacterium]